MLAPEFLKYRYLARNPVSSGSNMAALFNTFLRGLLGIAATIVMVAVVWSVYANRAPLIRAGELVIGVFTPRDEQRAPDTIQPVPRSDAAPDPAAGTYGESGQTVSPGPTTEPAR